MRVLLLALMIVLLPLRGWVGDVMALERLAPAQTTHAGQVPAHASAVADCDPGPGHHAQAHSDEAPAGEHTADGDCAGCTACQICHSVALNAVLPSVLTPVLPTLAPRASLPRYASAEPAPGFKPPIS